MSDGFAIGYDPCYGSDHSPRSPYYRQKDIEGYCALCEEPITSGEEIVRCGDKAAHYECFRINAPEEAVFEFLGITKETA